jgi:hypothetical protein
VILAPYGINGMLTGPVSREIDMNILRENWEKNYPVRHLEGLPDFVEVTTGIFDIQSERLSFCKCLGNARMFYPTCYVYKIGTHDESMTTNETTSTNKKSEISPTKKSKSTVANINTPTDLNSNINKIESSLIKDFADNLLIGAQRYNCIDLEKR